MAVPSPYFENVPGYGSLEMEQIIVDYVYPLLSVLKDSSGNRYLCMCFDTRGAQRWLITPISSKSLVSLLKNEITLVSPFVDASSKKIFAVLDYETRSETFQEMTACDIPAEYLPANEEYLDSESGEWDDYIQSLNSAKPNKKKGCYESVYVTNTMPTKWLDIYPSQYYGKTGRCKICVV